VEARLEALDELLTEGRERRRVRRDVAVELAEEAEARHGVDPTETLELAQSLVAHAPRTRPWRRRFTHTAQEVES
jgi:hypothetical protein